MPIAESLRAYDTPSAAGIKGWRCVCYDAARAISGSGRFMNKVFTLVALLGVFGYVGWTIKSECDKNGLTLLDLGREALDAIFSSTSGGGKDVSSQPEASESIFDRACSTCGSLVCVCHTGISTDPFHSDDTSSSVFDDNHTSMFDD